jgi:hypothetical protein
MLLGLKFCGWVIINTFVALVSTTILELAFGKAFSPQLILWKESCFSLLGAGVVGFLMWRIWRTAAAKWAWALPVLWLGAGLIHALLVRGTSDVFAGGNVWSQFSGTDCANGIASGCRNFFAYVIPFIRGVSYSVGAYFSSLLRSAPAPSDR